MKSILRRLPQAVTLVALGAVVYLAAEVARREMAPSQSPDDSQPLAVVEVQGAQTPDTAGNIVLENCLTALQRRASISVDLVQSGLVGRQTVQTSGAYLQKGLGDERRFSLLLQGRVGPSTCRLWQVSDGRFLWTDLAWDGAQAAGRRTVRRVDLRRVRAELSVPRAAQVAPGQAAAQSASGELWLGVGGLPMLFGSLGENFNFAAPRQRWLRNEPVYAMIGKWKPERLAALLAPPRDKAKESHKESSEETSVESAPPKLADLPPRVPHHVLVVIGARDLFPRLIEYRSAADPLSAAALTDDARIRESSTPLVKMDLLTPRFDAPIDDRRFAYSPPEGVDWQDQTDERMASRAAVVRR